MAGWHNRLKLDSLCDNFELELKQGNSPSIESYLDSVDPASRQFVLSELLCLELDYLNQRGVDVDLKSYANRFTSDYAIVKTAFRAYASGRRQQQACFSPAAPTVTGQFETIGDTGHSPARPSQDSIDFEIDGYEMVRQIGEGGMGRVCLALEKSSRRMVAIKCIRPGGLNANRAQQRILQERFQKEAHAAANLDHPNIATVYAVGSELDDPYYVMQYIDGSSIADQLQQPFEAARVAEITLDIANAINYSHSKGVLHRDLKPSNVLIDSKGDAHVVDFGMAKWIEDDEHLTQTGAVLGTPAYMAPEQLGNQYECSQRTDIYGIGAIMYAMLTARAPYLGSDSISTVLQVLDGRLLAPGTINPDVDKDLETLCVKCLESSPANRYLSVIELVEELERYVRGYPIKTRPQGMRTKLFKWMKRNPLVAGMSAMVLFVITMAIAGVSWQWRTAVSNAEEAKRQTEISREYLADARGVVNDFFTLSSEEPLMQEMGMQALRKKFYEKSLAYYLKFLQHNRDDESLKFECAMAHLRIGRIHFAIGKRADALNSFRNSVQLFTTCVDLEETNIHAQSQFANALSNLATLERLVHSDIESALALQQKAIRIQRAVCELDEEPVQLRQLAKMNNQLALIYRSSGDSAKQLLALKRSIDLHQSADEKQKPTPREVLARSRSQMNLGNYYSRIKDFENATPCYDTIIQSLTPLVKQHPQLVSAQSLLAQNHVHLAQCAQENNEFDQAIQHYQSATPILEKIGELYPNVPAYQMNIRLNLQSQAYLYASMSELQLAKKCLARCAEILESLNQANPDSRNIQRALAKDNLALGELELELGNKTQAREHVSTVRLLLTKLEDAVSPSPQVKLLRSRLETLVTKLENENTSDRQD